ncbi:MAG: PDZ domain-containing protein [Acidobacteriota bacterium]
MTGSRLPEAPPAAARPRARTALLRPASLAVLILTVVVIIVAIPANLKRQRTVSLGGVEGQVNASGEVVFTRVAPGTPSAKAGIAQGDILVAVDGQALKGSPAPARILGRLDGRAGTAVSLTVRTGDSPPRTVSVMRSPEPGSIAERLGSIGIGTNVIIGYLIFLDIVVLLVYLGVSVVLILHRRGTPLTYFGSVALATFGAAATTSVQVLAYEPSGWGRLAAALVPTGFAAAFTFMGFLYPNGRWVPRGGRVMAAVVWAWTFAQWFWPAARPGNWGSVPALAVYLAMIVAMFAAQVRRYRRAATPAEREQIKWFVAALASVVVGYAVSQAAALAIGELARRPAGVPGVAVFVLWQISTLGYQVPYALLAVAIGRALLKHRLWDIDVVINRSLVYSSVTTLLAVLSAVLLPLVSRLIGRLAGKVSPALAVLITAAFPILAFNPLRARVQRFVDRRMKPEDVTFDETSDLLGLELQAWLGPGELMGTLVGSVAGQLDLAAAAAYVPEGGDGRLVLARETPSGAGSPHELALGDEARGRLRQGGVVAPPDGSAFSFLVPLVAARTPGAELSGVLALGARRNGRGYTTPLERGLRVLGVEAGKAIYVARLRESDRSGLEDRLDRIERRIAELKP